MGSRHVRALLERDDVLVSAIADPSPAAQVHAMELVAAVRGRATLRVYSGPEEMLARERLDAVVIATPPSLHQRHCLLALEAKIGVLVEKPMALRAQEARVIIEALERTQTPFLVGHVERFNPAIRALKERLAESESEHPWLIETWRFGPKPELVTGYDVGQDLAIHDVDLVCHLVGQEPVSVRASSEGRDQLFGELSFASGTVARVSVGWHANDRVRRIVVQLVSKRFEVDCLRQEIKAVHPDGPQHAVHLSGDPLVAEHDAFLATLANGTQSPVSGSDGLRALSIVEALFASASAGTPIHFSSATA